jgi:signal transduction histidine kinase
VAESGRLEQLAREFTEFGRLPEGPAAPVDLVELLTGLARSSVPPTMTVRLALDPDLPTVLGHHDPLHRAFSNIVRNAVEACGGEGVVELAAARVDGGVRIEIRDHGPGVPPEVTSTLFDPYVTAKSGGTGLGLALARQTIEMHQGSIALEATPGGGATFVVRIRAG